MEDTFQVDKTAALELAALIRDHRGEDVIVMDLREINHWTDFFVVATVSSSAHVQGLQRHIKDYARDKGIEILRQHRKASSDDEWNLIDLGNIVVHLMSSGSRSFYELERLWSAAVIVSP
ncbi:iojap family protein [Treponema primitia ZAS-2]|uniref:Ribosomal silencing factor RsfS n=1 Tax=Treponema primitia (strain ATCC BAA-887 / DSM 12427 / ZAS-2) TaxID=545694 RepID=F5YJG7_TREPZ|nr:ribosome silencing factor [Treponema primitia]AEF86341.1 iojap family protein [Treponema primitia ZAS-2]